MAPEGSASDQNPRTRKNSSSITFLGMNQSIKYYNSEFTLRHTPQMVHAPTPWPGGPPRGVGQGVLRIEKQTCALYQDEV